MSIGAGASIGARTIIYPNVVIGPGARIGDDCVIHSQVSIRERVVVGHRVIVQDGAVLGSDGFGFARQPDGTHLKIPQRADVVIEDDVEIGANTTIDRPAVGETRIGAGTKIDNLVQIGHGVTIGRRVLFAAQVGIAGSCVIEDDVVLAGQVGVADHVRLGKGVVATAQTGIPNSVDAGGYVSGYPAIDHREWLKSSAVFRQLPALRKARCGPRAAHRGARGEARRMRHAVGSLARSARRVPSLVAAAASARAQSSRWSSRHRAPQFMSRFDFHIVGERACRGDDPHFSWDTHWGGDFDFVDYVTAG